MAINQQRGYHAKQRNTGKRRRNSLVLMIAEGKNKTETRYFTDMARELSLYLKFAPGNDTDPISMVDVLKRACTECDWDTKLGDEAFCLVDSDFNPDKNRQLSQADSMLSDGIYLIVSSPCFEVWYLCHFGSSRPHYNNNAAVIEDLRKNSPVIKKTEKVCIKRLHRIHQPPLQMPRLWRRPVLTQATHCIPSSFRLLLKYTRLLNSC